MRTLIFLILFITHGYAIDADKMDIDDPASSRSATMSQIHSGTSSPAETLEQKVVRSIFDYPGNRWAADKIDALKTNALMRCLEMLIWEGDGNIWLYVRDMIHRGILKNSSRGFGKLELSPHPTSEDTFKDYLKQEVAKIHDRQQADITLLETGQ